MKLDRDLVARARFVAQQRGLTLAAYLTEAVRPIVTRDFMKAVRAVEEEPQ